MKTDSGDSASVWMVAPGGALHELAACPHLGCIVAWNSLKRSWDCPCHGSRFDKCDGHAINGSAIAGLSSV
jgi:Rieske Fe-S protein